MRVSAALRLQAVFFGRGFRVPVPAGLKVPVCQFLFLGYWFWAKLMPPRIGLPSLIGTMLNATGPWALEGLFGHKWPFLQLHSTAAQAYMSIALLVGLGLVAMLGAWGYLRYQQAQR